MAGLNDYESLPELVRDSRLQTSWDRNPQQLRIIHTRLVGHETRRREEIWTVNENLGKGGFGSVSLQSKIVGTSDQPALRAVKSIRVSKSDPNTTPPLYVRELEALAKFSQEKYSDFFVKFYGWYDSPGQLHIAMEYCKLGDLREYLHERCPESQMPENEVQEIAVQILGALSLMHKEHFAHRDLKPANILIFRQPPEHWWVKLCDLGLSKRIEGTAGYTPKTGTPIFMAPEVPILEKKEIIDPYSADMWSFGMTIFRALTGQCSSIDLQLSEYRNNGASFPIQVLRSLAVSEAAIDFLGSVMTTMPSKRLTADQAEKHPWMGGNDSPSRYMNSFKCHYDQVGMHTWLPETPFRSTGGLTQASGEWSTTAIERFPPPGVSKDDMKREKLDKMDKSADNLYKQMRYGEAERQYQQLMELRINLLGKEDQDTLDTMHRLARTLHKQNKYDEAERLYRDTAEFRIKVLGREHPATLQTILNLATVYHDQERYDDAKKLYHHVVVIRTKVWGERHYDTVCAMDWLANTYCKQNKYDQAETLYQDVLKFRTKAFGKKHIDTLQTMHNLARILSLQQKYDKAEKLGKEALELRVRLLGIEHPHTLGTMHNLGNTYHNHDEYDKAEKLYRLTIELRMKVLSREHLDTLETMYWLAVTYHSQKKYNEAEMLFRDTMELRIKVLGKEHCNTLQTMHMLACMYSIQHKYDEAERLCQDTVELRIKVLGEGHPDTLQTMHHLASLFYQQGKYDEAERLYRVTMELRIKLLGKQHSDTRSTMYWLAYMLNLQQKYVEVERLCGYYETQDQRLGEGLSNTL